MAITYYVEDIEIYFSAATAQRYNKEANYKVPKLSYIMPSNGATSIEVKKIITERINEIKALPEFKSINDSIVNIDFWGVPLESATTENIQIARVCEMYKTMIQFIEITDEYPDSVWECS